MQDSELFVVLQTYFDAAQGTMACKANAHGNAAWTASVAQGDFFYQKILHLLLYYLSLGLMSVTLGKQVVEIILLCSEFSGERTLSRLSLNLKRRFLLFPLVLNLVSLALVKIDSWLAGLPRCSLDVLKI